MKCCRFILFILLLAPSMLLALEEDVVTVAQVLDPSLSGEELIEAMDRLMARTSCDTRQGPGLGDDCQIIPRELADIVTASRSLQLVAGSNAYRACGVLRVREGVDLAQVVHAQAAGMTPAPRMIVLQDPLRGEVRVSVNRFGVGVRIGVDGISEGSSLKVGVGKKGGAGATLNLRIP